MRTPALLPFAILVAAMSASVAITAIRHSKAAHTSRPSARLTVHGYDGSYVVAGTANDFTYDGHTIAVDVTPSGSAIFRAGFERSVSK